MNKTALAALVVCAAFAFSGVQAVWATDYTWVNTTPTGSGQSWSTVSSWKVGDETATDYPKTTADNADLSLRPSGGYQAVYFPSGALGVGTLIGTVQHMLHFYNAAATVTVDNPNDFRGTWQFTLAGVAESTVKFDPPASTFVPTLSAVHQSAGSRINVNVAEGKAAKVGSVYGSAQIAKSGAGGLTVGEIVGADRTRVTASTGSVEVEGRDPEQDGQLPIGGAWVHFDASDTNSYLETETRADGRTYVTKWGDLSGLGHHATKSSNSNVESAPFVNATRRPNGLNLMDFGSWVGDKSDDKGPSCGVQFTGTAKNHELFVVFEDTSSKSKGYFFGDNNGGPSYARDYSAGAHIFHGSDSKDYVRFGAITLDGARVENGQETALGTWDSAADAPRLRVLSIGIDSSVATAASAVSQIAADRSVARTGGIRVGEFLIYTNSFTHAERLRVVKYLMRKWLPAEKSQKTDLGGLYLKASTAQTVAVPEGRLAQVGEIHAKAGAFVKDGAGTLAVDALGTELKKITVSAGDVVIRPAYAPVTDATQPAASPCAWFDANASGSFTHGENPNPDAEAGPDWITEWRDCRPGATLKATSVQKSGTTGYPSLIDGPKEGLKAVKFGGYMTLSSVQSKTRDGFIVVRINGTDASEINFFGGSHFKRNTGLGNLLWDSQAGKASMSARWYVNGVLHDPYDSISVLNRTDYFVISFSADVDRSVDSFAVDGSRNWYGNLQVGEMVLYDRALTEAERRQTETYLMNRWLTGKTPSYTQSAVPELAYPAGADLVLDADADVSFARPSGGNGAYVKRGTGAATMPALNDGDAKSFAVEAGTLDLDFGDPLDDAIYHLDASDPNTLVCETADAGDGASVSNVLKWCDIRGNGISAISAHDNANYPVAVARPTVTNVETRAGVWRPAVSFGGLNADDAAGFYFTDASVNSALESVREVHLVFGDVRGHSGFVLGDGSKYPFHRGNNGHLADGASQSPYVGYIDGGCLRLDGAKATRSTAVSDFGAHLLMVAPSGSVPFRTLAIDRSARAGGTYECEVLMFAHTNDTRTANYIQRKLRYKWFGEGEKPVWTNAVASLSAAEGAKLNLRNAPVISVPNLAGSGTIRLGAAIGVSSLSLDGELTVDGAVVFAPQVRVTYTGVGLPRKGGESVAILTASSLEGFDASGWTLENPPDARHKYAFRRSGDTIYLECVPYGLMMIVR